MKKLKFLSIIILASVFAIPVSARDFTQKKNNFTGVQYFEGGVIFGTEVDSLDTLVAVSNDITLAGASKKALVTERAVKEYADTKVALSDLDSLIMAMRGYEEYTFSVRQDSTNAPVVAVIKDDFKLSGPIAFARDSAGIYTGDISSLELTPGADVNLYVSAAKEKSGDIFVYIESGSELIIRTTDDNVLSDKIGLVISIRKTFP